MAEELRSFLQVVEIAEIGLDRPSWERRCLGGGERASMAGRPLRSLAGLLALEGALGELYGAAGVSCGPLDLELGRAESGAPRLLRAPPLAGCLRISISHSRRHAYGVAVLEPRRG